MATITYIDKDESQTWPDPRKKVSDDDMNEIKNVVNANEAARLTNMDSFVYGETPTGTINGSNMAFTLANAATQNTVIASADGVPLRPVEDFTISGTTLTMTWAPEDYLFIHSYRK